MEDPSSEIDTYEVKNLVSMNNQLCQIVAIHKTSLGFSNTLFPVLILE